MPPVPLMLTPAEPKPGNAIGSTRPSLFFFFDWLDAPEEAPEPPAFGAAEDEADDEEDFFFFFLPFLSFLSFGITPATSATIRKARAA